MQAIIHRRYGGPEALSLEDVEPPTVADDGVLVRVHAASVNAFDWHMLRGKPYIARLTEGLRGPKDPAMGVDTAGVVEAVGSSVTHVRPGDEVVGARNGAFAEIVAGRTFVQKPAGITFVAAAAVPMAGCTALQALRDQGRVAPGQHVLVTGAGGGVGTFAVQIARALGATVTAVTSPSKVDLIGSLGADRVIDHTRADALARGSRYDLIVDIAGDRSLRALQRALSPDGTIVLVGPGRGDWTDRSPGSWPRRCARTPAAGRSVHSWRRSPARTSSSSSPGSGTARSPPSSTARSRWPRPRRRSATSSRAPPVARSSSPSDRSIGG